MRSINLTVH